jgi:hypothetical protein
VRGACAVCGTGIHPLRHCCSRCDQQQRLNALVSAIHSLANPLPLDVVDPIVRERCRSLPTLNDLELWCRLRGDRVFRDPSYAGAGRVVVHVALDLLWEGAQTVARPVCSACGAVHHLDRSPRGRDVWMLARHQGYCWQSCFRARPSPPVCARHGGTPTTGKVRGVCRQCRVAAAIEAMLVGAPPVLAAMAPILEREFAGGRNSWSDWLSRTGGITFRGLCEGRIPISHEGLDDFLLSRRVEDAAGGRTIPASSFPLGIERLRALLVATGCLPERNGGPARFRASLAVLLADPSFHPHDRWVIEQWARDRRLGLAALPAVSDVSSRIYKVRLSLDFLGELRARHVALDQARITHVNRWMSTKSPSARRAIRPFLRWYDHFDRRQPSLLPSQPGGGTHREGLAFGQHQVLVGRLRDGDDLPLRCRAAGVLLFLAGWSVARIVRVRVSDGAANAWQTLPGQEDFPLPLWATDLLRNQAAAALECALPGVTDPYLFGPPLLGGTQPATRGAMGVTLREHGLPVRRGQNSARKHLARKGGLPALLASGLSIDGASRIHEEACQPSGGGRRPRPPHVRGAGESASI